MSQFSISRRVLMVFFVRIQTRKMRGKENVFPSNVTKRKSKPTVIIIIPCVLGKKPSQTASPFLGVAEMRALIRFCLLYQKQKLLYSFFMQPFSHQKWFFLIKQPVYGQAVHGLEKASDVSDRGLSNSHLIVRRKTNLAFYFSSGEIDGRGRITYIGKRISFLSSTIFK